MLHTSIEVLAKQNKLRPRTQQSQRRDGLPVLRKREPLKAVRTPFTNEVFYPWPEEEELRPETPFVKTRLQRQVLGSGGSRSNVPSETADLFGSNGMYKRSIGFESPTLILRRANSREKNRCGTPLPLDQPLTKLCWNNGLGIYWNPSLLGVESQEWGRGRGLGGGGGGDGLGVEGCKYIT